MVEFIEAMKTRAGKGFDGYKKEVARLRENFKVEGFPSDEPLIHVLAIRDETLAVAEKYGLDGISFQTSCRSSTPPAPIARLPTVWWRSTILSVWNPMSMASSAIYFYDGRISTLRPVILPNLPCVIRTTTTPLCYGTPPPPCRCVIRMRNRKSDTTGFSKPAVGHGSFQDERRACYRNAV